MPVCFATERSSWHGRVIIVIPRILAYFRNNLSLVPVSFTPHARGVVKYEKKLETELEKKIGKRDWKKMTGQEDGNEKAGQEDGKTG